MYLKTYLKIISSILQQHTSSMNFNNNDTFYISRSRKMENDMQITGVTKAIILLWMKKNFGDAFEPYCQ